MRKYKLMKIFRKSRFTLTMALGTLCLAACDVDVQGEGKDRNVDVRTAFGDISVHTGENGPETGLPIYPGAQPVRDDEEKPESADVNIGTSFFGVHVAAAKFESKDTPQAIVDFYKDKMSTFGPVTECKGDVDFEGEPKQPVCKEASGTREIQLVTGTEESHRLVSVKPSGDGTEFAVVSIQIDERS